MCKLDFKINKDPLGYIKIQNVNIVKRFGDKKIGFNFTTESGGGSLLLSKSTCGCINGNSLDKINLKNGISTEWPHTIDVQYVSGGEKTITVDFIFTDTGRTEEHKVSVNVNVIYESPVDLSASSICWTKMSPMNEIKTISLIVNNRKMNYVIKAIDKIDGVYFVIDEKRTTITASIDVKYIKEYFRLNEVRKTFFKPTNVWITDENSNVEARVIGVAVSKDASFGSSKE